MKFYFTIYSVILGTLMMILLNVNSGNIITIFIPIFYMTVYSGMITIINYAYYQYGNEAAPLLMPLVGLILPFIGILSAVGIGSEFGYASIGYHLVLAIFSGLTLVTYVCIAAYFFNIKTNGVYISIVFIGNFISTLLFSENCYFIFFSSIICGLFLDCCYKFPLEQKGFYYTCHDMLKGYKRLINTENSID